MVSQQKEVSQVINGGVRRERLCTLGLLKRRDIPAGHFQYPKVLRLRHCEQDNDTVSFLVFSNHDAPSRQNFLQCKVDDLARVPNFDLAVRVVFVNLLARVASAARQ